MMEPEDEDDPTFGWPVNEDGVSIPYDFESETDRWKQRYYEECGESRRLRAVTDEDKKALDDYRELTDRRIEAKTNEIAELKQQIRSLKSALMAEVRKRSIDTRESA